MASQGALFSGSPLRPRTRSPSRRTSQYGCACIPVVACDEPSTAYIADPEVLGVDDLDPPTQSVFGRPALTTHPCIRLSRQASPLENAAWWTITMTYEQCSCNPSRSDLPLLLNRSRTIAGLHAAYLPGLPIRVSTFNCCIMRIPAP